MQSQVMPYLEALSREDMHFFLISFERAACSREVIDGVRARGIKWFRLGYHRWPRFLATSFDIMCGVVLSIRVGIQYRIDIIHTRSYVPQVIAYLARFFLKQRIVFDMRGFMIDEYREAGLIRSNALYAFGKKLESTLLNIPQDIIVLTHRHKEELGRSYLKRKNAVRVIPCSINMDTFIPNPDKYQARKKRGLPEGHILVYSGTLGSWYKLDEMLRFFEVFATVSGNATFLILTHSPRALVERALQGAPYASRVIVKDIPHADMPVWVSCADSGIAFYLPSYSRCATSPVKVAEYLACGLPIVMSDGIGDMSGYVTQFGLGVTVARYAQEEYRVAAAELMRLCREPARRAAIRDFAYRHYNFNDAKTAYKTIYYSA